MPISVVCESCEAKLNAPDAAAGKTVKCPKCKAPLTVPAAAAPQFEVMDDEEDAPKPAKKAVAEDEAPKPAKKKPVIVDDDDEEDEKPRKKKPVVVDDEDEDEKSRNKKPVVVDDEDEEKPKKKKKVVVDEDEDDRPKKKKKKKLVSAVDSGNMARNIIGGVVLLIALGFVAYVWWDRAREKDKESDKQSKKDEEQPRYVPPPGGPGPGSGRDPVTPGPKKSEDIATDLKTPTPTLKFKVQLPADANGLEKLTLTSNGSRMGFCAGYGKDAKVQIWNLSGKADLLGSRPGDLYAFAPDGKTYVASVSNDKGPVLVDSETGTHLKEDVYADHYRDGQTLIQLQRFGKDPFKIISYKVQPFQESGSFEGHSDGDVYPSPPVENGRFLYVFLNTPKKIRLLDLTNGATVRDMNAPPTNPKATSVTFKASADGRWLYLERSGGPEGSTREILDAKTGSTVATLPKDMGSAYFCLAPGGLFITASNIASTKPDVQTADIAVYSIERKKVIANLTGHIDRVRVAVSEDGKVLASGDAKGNVMLWDLTQIK